MIGYQKKIDIIKYEDITIPKGTYYGKLEIEDNVTYFKFTVREDDYDHIRVVNLKYRKTIDNGLEEYGTIWNMEKIFNKDSGTSFISKEEFDKNYNEVISYLFSSNVT